MHIWQPLIAGILKGGMKPRTSHHESNSTGFYRYAMRSPGIFEKQIHKLDLQWSILYLGDACLRLDERDMDRKARAMNICFKRHPHFQQVTLHWIQEGVIVTTDR